MDRINFKYWKENATRLASKSFQCIHGSYIYGDNMNANNFRFGYYENGQINYINSNSKDLKDSYFRFIEMICNNSEQAFHNFRNSDSDKYKIFTKSEIDSFSEEQQTSTRIKDDSCKIIVKNVDYYVANNLKISEYLNNIAQKLPEDELENYFMELNNNSEGKMGRKYPNCIYIRKVNESGHDEGKEINIGMPTWRFFFEEEKQFTFRRKKNPTDPYHIGIQAIPDPRLGVDFKSLLKDDGGIEQNDLIVIYKEDKKNYLVEVVRPSDDNYHIYNLLYEDANSNERHSWVVTENDDDLSDSEISQATKPTEDYEQIVYYGVPGSGKSFKIDNEKTKGASDYQKQRVVFHPDYTNSDFIGQIIPKMKEIDEAGTKKSIIEYSFKPGPFTTILRRALRDKGHQYYLIIEEINRGNAAAIFGDLFQLLDRTDDGWSCSPVNNDDINYYIASKYEYWEEQYSDNHPYEAETINHPNGTPAFTRNTGLRLPPNLSIYATMNTNDQNVFTLDNAFNRRIKPEYISNKENPALIEHVNQFNLLIGDTNINWGSFREQINKKIIESGFANAEDKQLGLFFIKKSKNETKILAKDFSDKVLKYLWHDVFKRERSIFSGTKTINKFEDLIDNFNDSDAFEKCFKSDFITELKNNKKDLCLVTDNE